MKKPTRVYMTTYCNRGHRMSDGKPVDHECVVLPPKALRAERDGDCGQAAEIIQQAKPLRPHRGTRGPGAGPPSRPVPEDASGGGQRVFVALDDGTFLCEGCLPEDLRARLGDDDVSVWEEGSGGWTGPVSCRTCGRAIPVLVGGAEA